jgi:hypothetical protein
MNAPNLDTRITTDLPPMIEGPIPVKPYVSAEFFERERIFKRLAEPVPGGGPAAAGRISRCSTSRCGTP